MLDETSNIQERKAWLSLMARAPEGRLAALAHGLRPGFDWLRKPETGSVMLRGRAGATGSPFNLGEMTVTRCSLKLTDGTVGHGYIQGRSKADAEAAALVDAMMQTADAETARNSVIKTLEAEETTRRDTRARKAAATKVEFFTLVRGED
ncbi:phosphonate C-P lyase system protein PhnG [Pseudoruegeria sp. HB172150]|uniref:phosphonate C-P lyase system protein PhnG n=1 Tax=Pseudoruegeria sp. HB172150 TaxID=2721164 RepID=UPI0015576E58|nr:phosphonate C-P lyase system protein PhnG [Pseudoruegeria sp. HB172150]